MRFIYHNRPSNQRRNSHMPAADLRLYYLLELTDHIQFKELPARTTDSRQGTIPLTGFLLRGSKLATNSVCGVRIPFEWWSG